MPTPSPSLTREVMIETLHAAMAAAPPVIALFLAGSDATGRTDPGSDIDACAIVEDDAVEEILARAEAALVALSPLRSRYRLPEPTWHGHSQVFLLLEDADPRHMIDLVVMKRSAPDHLLEPERHGRPRILIDREGLVRPHALDRAAHHARMAAHLESLAARFDIFQPLVTKALERGHHAEAAQLYLAMTWRPLVDVLRTIHCPERFDFGPRYLDRDVPASVRRDIEELALAGTAPQLAAHHAAAIALFHEALPRARRRVETWLDESEPDAAAR